MGKNDIYTYFWSHNKLKKYDEDEDEFKIYLRDTELNFKKVLCFLDPEQILDFRTIGGHDKNGTYLEHSVHSTIEFVTKPFSEPLKIMMMKENVSTIKKYFKKENSIGFNIHKFCLETADRIFCANRSCYNWNEVFINMPSSKKDWFMNRMSKEFPRYYSLFENGKNRKFQVYKNGEVEVEFTNIKNIQDFVNKFETDSYKGYIRKELHFG